MTIEADNNQTDVQTETVESEIGEVTAAEAEQDADTISLADDASEAAGDDAEEDAVEQS